MAGPTPGTPVEYGTSDSVAAASSNTYEHDSGQCYYFEIWASITTDASATDGVDVSVRRKTAASGTAADTGLTKSVPINTTEVLYMGIYDAGTVNIVVTNNDASYAATINDIWVREAS